VKIHCLVITRRTEDDCVVGSCEVEIPLDDAIEILGGDPAARKTLEAGFRVRRVTESNGLKTTRTFVSAEGRNRSGLIKEKV
jgi:hypothetical protein